MFYEAAGGRRYTGLWNGYQEFRRPERLAEDRSRDLVAQDADARRRRARRAPSCSATASRWPARKISTERSIGLFFP